LEELGDAYTPVCLFFLLVLTGNAIPQVSYETAPPGRAPIVVFVPGILGSTLTNGDKVLWGNRSGEQNLLYDGTLLIARPLDRVTMLGTELLSRMIYGTYFTEMAADLSRPDSLSIFSYDWRASNLVSGGLLGEHLCGLDPEKPIILVAHSMGGLVVKNWLIDHYESKCPDGRMIELAHLLFVATPHFGAPQSVQTVLHEVQLIGGVPLLDNWISYPINRYGLTFDSIYELFPASHAYSGNFDRSSLCISEERRSAHPELGFRVGYERENWSRAKPLDIFDARVLMQFGIGERLVSIGIDNPLRYLQRKLDAANNAICRLARFEIPEELADKVQYIVGNESNNREIINDTSSDIVISDYGIKGKQPFDSFFHDASARRIYLYAFAGPGDNTVPVDLAWVPSSGIRSRKVITGTNHLDVLDHLSFREELNTLLAFAQWEAPVLEQSFYEYFGPESEAIALASVANNVNLKGLFVHSTTWSRDFIDLERLSSDPNLLSAYADSGAIAHDGMVSDAAVGVMSGTLASVEDVLAYAEGNSDPQNWAFASNVVGLSDRERIYTAARAAQEYYNVGRADEARDILNDIKYYTRGNSEISAGVDLSNIFLNSAWTNIILGDGDAAMMDLEDAKSQDSLLIIPAWGVVPIVRERMNYGPPEQISSFLEFMTK
jgi:pimeloyl-ACP methyl ester carboxylesterase